MFFKNNISQPVIIEKKAGRAKTANYYVPGTRRARTELGLEATIPLREAIRKTIAFYRSAH